MKEEYSEPEQEPETITAEENDKFDQNLAKILLVGLITTGLFFLKT